MKKRVQDAELHTTIKNYPSGRTSDSTEELDNWMKN
jgi:hypothetical protein